MEAIVGTVLVLLGLVTFVVLIAIMGHGDDKSEESWHIDPLVELNKKNFADQKEEYKKSVRQGFKPKKTRWFKQGHMSYGHLNERNCRWYNVC